MIARPNVFSDRAPTSRPTTLPVLLLGTSTTWGAACHARFAAPAGWAMFGRLSAIPRVLVVEDGRTDRQWLADQLAGHAGLAIVGGAETLADAIAAAAGLVPRGVDAVVIDLGLRDSEGVDAVRDFPRAQPRLPLVVVSGDNRK